MGAEMTEVARDGEIHLTVSINDGIRDLSSLIARGAEVWSAEATHLSASDRAVVQAAFAELLRVTSDFLEGDAFLTPSSWSWLQKGNEATVVSNVQQACARLCNDPN